MDEEPFSYCNLTEFPHDPILPFNHVFPKLIHINRDPMYLDTKINDEPTISKLPHNIQGIKNESIVKGVPNKNE